MNRSIYKIYSDSKKTIEEFENECIENEPAEVKDWIESLRECIEHIEISKPEYKSTYELRRAAEKSFSYEQKAHICYQIGEWYLEWKHKMWVDGKPNEHFLGMAKEELKIMICGKD